MVASISFRLSMAIVSELTFLSSYMFYHKAEEVQFCADTDLLETFFEVLIRYKVWSGPLLKTNGAGSFLNTFLENCDGLSGFGTFLFLKMLKVASMLGRLGAGCGGLPSSGLALLLPG